LQTHGKAYPAIRELRVAKAVGASGIVGSICPKTVDASSADFGYGPTARALAQRAAAVFATYNP
jgi:hypothetical protein